MHSTRLLLAFGVAGILIQPAPAQTGATLAGRVMDVGGGPIAGAEVMLTPQGPAMGPRFEGPASAVTDREGRYQFRGIPPGRYRVFARKTGFARLNDAPPSLVSLADGEQNIAPDLVLQKGAVIPGRVVDENGEPVARAQVTPLRRPAPGRGASARRGAIPGGERAETNDLGEFRLFGLQPGDYFVQATVQTMLGRPSAAVASPGIISLPTYFPNAPDLEGAQPITVTAGETAGAIEIRLLSAPSFILSGVVINGAGQPVKGALVSLTSEDRAADVGLAMSGWHRTHSDANGAFTIAGIPSGRYSLLAVAPVVIARQSRADVRGGSFEMSSGISGAGVTTETANGVTVEYRDERGTRTPVTIAGADLIGLEIVVSN